MTNDKEYMRQWKEQNPEKVKLYAARHYNLHKEIINSSKVEARKERHKFLNWLKSQPCVDCKKNYPPVCMDFDHVRGKKVASIGRMYMFSWEKLQEELKKCEPVCSNCHRIRTWVTNG